MDRAAGTAAVFGPVNADDAKLCRNPIEHLARRLADRVNPTAAVGAFIALDIEHDIRAWQMARKSRAPWRGRGMVPRRFRAGGFRSGDIGVEVFKPESQLIGVEAFGPASEPSALKLSDDALKAFDLVVAGLDDSRHVAHQMMQKADI